MRGEAAPWARPPEAACSAPPIVQRAHHLALDAADDGEEVEKQHHVAGGRRLLGTHAR